jgi:hypothetical protein
MNSFTPTPHHPNQPQNSEAQGQSEQDSEEEIEAVIENEIACLRQDCD